VLFYYPLIAVPSLLDIAMYRVQELTMFLRGMEKKLLCGKKKKTETRIEETHRARHNLENNKKLKVTKNRKIIKKYMKEKHTMFFFAPL